MTIEHFLDSRIAAGRSPATVDWYGRMLRHVEAWLGRPLASISAGEIEQYLKQRRLAGLKPSSVAASYRALHAWGKWAQRRKLVRKSPMRGIEAPKVPRRRPRRAGRGEIERLLASIDGGDWMDYRDRLVVLLGFYSGLRVAEIAGLHLEDLEFTAGLILVTAGKGDKQRLAPIHPRVRVEWTAYLYNRPAWDGPELLLASDGRDGVRGPLTHSGIRQMLQRRCRRAGIRELNPHSLRHGFATEFATAGVPLATLARIMGHTSTAVTERFYAEWLQEGLLREYNKALEQIRGLSE